MDFTKFSDENFDLKNWINSVFVTQKDTNQNVEQFVATLVTKLQVFIQEINNSIDDTSQQTVQNFPRILREIEVLKQEAFMLKEQMKNVREDLIKVEKNTVNDSMKLLLDLDIMRTNMLNVQTCLQEADNWSTLTSDLDSILQTKDINRISDHIQSMQNSLTLLQDENNEYLIRCNLLEDFKNKFETLMSPDIIDSFNTKSINAVLNYVQIFGQMNRLEDLKKYYYQCEKAKILEKISLFIAELNSTLETVPTNPVATASLKIDNPNSTPGDSLRQLINKWLDYSIEVWQNEIHWCKQIFNDAHAIVTNLLTKCFEEFNKSFVSLIDKFSANSVNQEYVLDCLVKLKLVNSEFKNFDLIKYYIQSLSLKETDRFSSVINSNAENASLLKNSQLNDLMFKLVQQLYSPYRVYLAQYTTLEAKYLQYQLETNIKMSHPITSECIQLLGDSVGKIFNLIDREIERCVSFTNGCGLAMLIDALKIFLKSYVEEFKRIVINLKERKSFDKNQFNVQKTNEGAEDWESFRHFVKIIQIVGDLIIKYEDLERVIVKKIQEIFLHSSPKTPTTQLTFPTNQLNDYLTNLLSVYNFKEYLLNDSDRIKLNRLISVIESGDDYSMMNDLLKPLYILSENVHKYAFEIVFAPVKYLIKNLSKSNIWSKKDIKHQQENVPLFAFAPQEYITKIGQYLLTLPQNFESFTMQDNASLIVALHKGKLPYLDVKDLSDDITACWLDSIANATAINYCDEILNIQQNLSINSQRQLIIDIEFICSVFEDVGLKEFNNLYNVLQLLKVSSDDFEETSKNMPVRIVSSVRKMRSL